MVSYLAVIQARMGSTRLPGKVMLDLCGWPVIWHIVERMKLSKKLDQIVVATSTQSKDDPLYEYVKKTGTNCFRGSESDVLGRFYSVSQKFPSKVVIRETADNPLVDPKLLDETIDYFEKERFQFVRTRGFPTGIGIEVFETELLHEAHTNAHSESEREHVTPYMFAAGRKYGEYASGRPLEGYRLTLDTKEDYELIREIYEHLYKGAHDFFLDDILRYLESRPEHISFGPKDTAQ